jgi:hypothetical protein
VAGPGVSAALSPVGQRPGGRGGARPVDDFTGDEESFRLTARIRHPVTMAPEGALNALAFEPGALVPRPAQGDGGERRADRDRHSRQEVAARAAAVQQRPCRWPCPSATSAPNKRSGNPDHRPPPLSYTIVERVLRPSDSLISSLDLPHQL